MITYRNVAIQINGAINSMRNCSDFTQRRLTNYFHKITPYPIYIAELIVLKRVFQQNFYFEKYLNFYGT